MDGKKKKNKKKKGNSRSTLTDDDVEQVIVPNQDNGYSPQLNHLPRVSSTTDAQSVGVLESDFEPDKHKVYDEKFIKLQEEIRQLRDERNQWMQKEASLDEKVQLLQSDMDSYFKKEAGFEEKLKSLQSGNDLLMQKQVIFEDRVNRIEGIKDSWILKEAMINEMASRWDDVNLKLQEQVKEVKELKESRDELVQENAKLRQSIAVIESRVRHIETEAFLSKSSAAMMTTKQSSVQEIPQSKPETAPTLPSDVWEQEKTEVVEKEFNIEKLQLVEAEKRKIRQEYERKEKQVEIRRKIEYSMQLNASRIKVLQAQDDLVNSMKESASKELLRVSDNSEAYQKLLKDLIFQSLLRLKEPSVLLRCREMDFPLIESILDVAKQEYAEKAKVHTPKITIDEHVYLPPPPSGDDMHGLSCSGGVVLASQDGKIVCENTLDARLEVVFRKKLPEIRKCLFGKMDG